MAKSYTKINFNQGTTPAINETNLGAMDDGINDAIDQANTNETSITTNAGNISTNTTNISTNTTNISTNTSNISTNTTNISTNTTNIASNTSSISTNTSNISTNTSNISTNTTDIGTNTSDITNLEAASTHSLLPDVFMQNTGLGDVFGGKVGFWNVSNITLDDSDSSNPYPGSSVIATDDYGRRYPIALMGLVEGDVISGAAKIRGASGTNRLGFFFYNSSDTVVGSFDYGSTITMDNTIQTISITNITIPADAHTIVVNQAMSAASDTYALWVVKAPIVPDEPPGLTQDVASNQLASNAVGNDQTNLWLDTELEGITYDGREWYNSSSISVEVDTVGHRVKHNYSTSSLGGFVFSLAELGLTEGESFTLKGTISGASGSNGPDIRFRNNAGSFVGAQFGSTSAASLTGDYNRKTFEIYVSAIPSSVEEFVLWSDRATGSATEFYFHSIAIMRGDYQSNEQIQSAAVSAWDRRYLMQTHYGKEHLRKTAFKITQIDDSQTEQLKVLFLGDSWLNTLTYVYKPTIERLRAALGDGGRGFASAYSGHVTPTGLSRTISGTWSTTDNTDAASATALDLVSVSSSTAADYIEWT